MSMARATGLFERTLCRLQHGRIGKDRDSCCQFAINLYSQRALYEARACESYARLTMGCVVAF